MEQKRHGHGSMELYVNLQPYKYIPLSYAHFQVVRCQEIERLTMWYDFLHWQHLST